MRAGLLIAVPQQAHCSAGGVVTPDGVFRCVDEFAASVVTGWSDQSRSYRVPACSRRLTRTRARIDVFTIWAFGDAQKNAVLAHLVVD
ncbi:hypothetical protein AB0E59_42335 [Lentzea sp. NPDC034063]|uniref:hypothetical protein n=1 Tax=unclassified Lentzea TaxID=2643253 RepID=UPI0033D529E9